MTYCLNKKSPISHESRLLQLLGKVAPCITRPVVLKWSVTQVRLWVALVTWDVGQYGSESQHKEPGQCWTGSFSP
jgi:hypothetical protein